MPTRRRFIGRLAAAGTWALSGAGGAATPHGSRVRARILGTVQDGGMPHPGCTRACCVRIRRGAGAPRRVSCLGLGASPEGPLALVDATPDLPSQAEELRRSFAIPAPPGRLVDAIALTHAHIGHYTGLVYLGREAAGAREVPVIATPRMCSFLESNKPWSRLIEWGHVRLQPLAPGRSRALAPGLEIEPVAVPHRDEDSDTVGYLVKGPSKRLLYVPDTDSWRRWPEPVARLVAGADIALLDGTFFSPGEVTWRDPAEIPHPTIVESMELLESLAVPGRRRILFTHLNHTNAALEPDSEASREIARRGFEVAAEGLEIDL